MSELPEDINLPPEIIVKSRILELREGYEAYYAGAVLEDCPYKDDYDRASAWMNGWRMGCLEHHGPEPD